MIHPARRRAALLPARRGMRTSWLRCRTPDELQAAPAEDASATGTVPATDLARAETDPGDRDDVRPGVPREPLAAAAPGPVRPAFGHPTF